MPLSGNYTPFAQRPEVRGQLTDREQKTEGGGQRTAIKTEYQYGTAGRYPFKVRIRPRMVDGRGNVRHHEYARMFSDAREALGLFAVPNFKEITKYFLLLTYKASYDCLRDANLGNRTLTVYVGLEKILNASFDVVAEIVEDASNEICVRARQTIVVADHHFKPMKIPPGFGGAIKSLS